MKIASPPPLVSAEGFVAKMLGKAKLKITSQYYPAHRLLSPLLAQDAAKQTLLAEHSSHDTYFGSGLADRLILVGFSPM